MQHPSGTIDLSAFVREELRGFPTTASSEIQKRLAWRKTGFRAWRKGIIRFDEYLRNFLPGRFKSDALQRQLQRFLDQELDVIFHDAGLYDKSIPALFGKPFHAGGDGAFKNWLVAIPLLNEVILQDEYCARQYIRRDSIVIDAGANIGTFSVLAATLAPEGTIYAFEPASQAFGTLRFNTAPYPNITALRAALGAEVSTKILKIHETDVGSALADVVQPDARYVAEEHAPVDTIDAFVSKNQLSSVDFIKIDTEGYEKQILEGAAETIKKYKPVLALSAYHRGVNISDIEEIRTLILSLNPAYVCRLRGKDMICTSV